MVIITGVKGTVKFKEVDKLPPAIDTHWDLEEQEPVRLEQEEK